MADKTYEIELKTTSDTEGITSVKDALEETKSEVEEVNDALGDVGSSASDTSDELQTAFEEATAEVERLEEALIRTKARVLILDPIQAYLGGGMDMNRANEARDMTKRLGMLAEKYHCAIILIGHMNKASGNKAAYRGMGSIDFFAVARSVILVGRVEGEPNLRAVVQIKNNLAEFGHSLYGKINGVLVILKKHIQKHGMTQQERNTRTVEI